MRGQIQAVNTTTKVITLTNASDMVFFENDMALKAYVDSTFAERTGIATITACDRENGTITYAGEITDIAATDHLAVMGDYSNVIKGIGAWVPYGASRATELSTSFFGLDRSVDPTRLGGWYQDYSADPIEEALNQGLEILSREGGMTSHIFMNNLDYRNLINSLGSKVVYKETKVADVGFRGVEVIGHNSTPMVYPDRTIPKGYAYFMQMDTWNLYTLGDLVNIFDADGQTVHMSQVADGVEIRVYMYAQLGCHAPGYNGIFKIS